MSLEVVWWVGGAVAVTLAVLMVWERLFGKSDPPG